VEFVESPLVEIVAGDVSDRSAVEALFSDCQEDGKVSVFHLASIMSGEGEEDFDLCLAVNMEGSMNILEALRKLPGTPKLVFAGSMAAMGSCSAVEDSSKYMPNNTYGMTKVRDRMWGLFCLTLRAPQP